MLLVIFAGALTYRLTRRSPATPVTAIADPPAGDGVANSDPNAPSWTRKPAGLGDVTTQGAGSSVAASDSVSGQRSAAYGSAGSTASGDTTAGDNSLRPATSSLMQTAAAHIDVSSSTAAATDPPPAATNGGSTTATGGPAAASSATSAMASSLAPIPAMPASPLPTGNSSVATAATPGTAPAILTPPATDASSPATPAAAASTSAAAAAPSPDNSAAGYGSANAAPAGSTAVASAYPAGQAGVYGAAPAYGRDSYAAYQQPPASTYQGGALAAASPSQGAGVSPLPGTSARYADNASGYASSGPAYGSAPAGYRSALVCRATGWSPRRATFRRAGGAYEVQPNDNYYLISQKVYGTPAYFRALAEQNRGKAARPDRLTPGLVIATPPVAQLEQAYPDLCPKPERRETIRNRAAAAATISNVSYAGGGRTYVVQEGDTLSSIARNELGKVSRWAEIYALNRDVLGRDYDYLSPGMRLILPGKDQAGADRLARQPRADLR